MKSSTNKMEAWSANVRKLLKATGLTQAEFGNLFDVGHSAVGNWKHGQFPDVGKMIEVGDYFKLTVAQLLGEGGEIPSLGLSLEKTIRDIVRDEIAANDVSSGDAGARRLAGELLLCELEPELQERLAQIAMQRVQAAGVSLRPSDSDSRTKEN